MSPLLSVDEYLQRILCRIPEPEAANVPLDEAYGCLLAAGVEAPNNLPAFPSSAMDGFAVRSADIAAASGTAPVGLAIVGEVLMGRPAHTEVGEGEAVSIPTGGMMPPGADSVVPIEQCLVGPRVVHVYAASRPGRNVRPAGEDLLGGETLVPAGRRLGAADLGALAAAGFAGVEAFRRPRVVIFSTGNELVEGGGSAGSGQVHESNSFMLRGLVLRAGADPVYAGRVPDDPEALLGALTAAPPGEVLVCSGGVSAGRDDPVRRAFGARDEVHCLQVSVQPGRPQAFGIWCGKPFFGLPGNPMASLVSFELFVRPALRKMMGLPSEVEYLQATLHGDLEAATGSVRFVPVRLRGSRPTLAVCSPDRRRSNQLAKLARADGLAEVPPGADLHSGDPVRVICIRER